MGGNGKLLCVLGCMGCGLAVRSCGIEVGLLTAIGRLVWSPEIGGSQRERAQPVVNNKRRGRCFLWLVSVVVLGWVGCGFDEPSVGWDRVCFLRSVRWSGGQAFLVWVRCEGKTRTNAGPSRFSPSKHCVGCVLAGFQCWIAGGFLPSQRSVA